MATKNNTPKIPRGKDAWELYSRDPLSGKAARALTTALVAVRKAVLSAAKKAVREHRFGRYEGARDLLWFSHTNHSAFLHTVGSAYCEAVREHLSPVRNKYAAQGACDTEPRCVANEYLRRVLATELGGSDWDWADCIG